MPNKKGYIPWNTGLTKETDSRIARQGKRLSENIRSGKITQRRRKLTDSEKLRISLRQTLHNKGGRCKWFNVDGQKVQGTWERDIALKLTELGIKWEKLKTRKHVLSYSMDGKSRNYTPDFFLEDFGIYLEVKGFWWGEDRRKMEAVFKKYPDLKIILIEESEYRKIMQGELVW